MKILCSTVSDIFDRINDKDLWVHVEIDGVPAWLKRYETEYAYIVMDCMLDTIRSARPEFKRKTIESLLSNNPGGTDIPWWYAKDHISILFPIEMLTTAELYDYSEE